MVITVPNILSILRILSIPVFIIVMSYGMIPFALAIFVFAGITDALDGFIARWFHQKTAFGAYLDPIADKLLLASSFVCCAVLQLIPKWLSVLVVSRDVIISTGILLLWVNGYRIEIKPSAISKCTTFLQLLSISMRLLLETVGTQRPEIVAVYWVTGLLTVVSGIHYITVGLRVVNAREPISGR
ncbi:MAG: CDP-alcohol phosphatidyltransferase family protein [Desulfobacterota bacterium]|nr:CDP-alcohol phosphatidyltransferase family protein [Thermodesulfobacteriota bacterium]